MHFVGVFLVVKSPQHRVRVSVGLRSLPEKLPSLSMEAGPCCPRPVSVGKICPASIPILFPMRRAFLHLPRRGLSHAADEHAVQDKAKGASSLRTQPEVCAPYRAPFITKFLNSTSFSQPLTRAAEESPCVGEKWEDSGHHVDKHLITQGL